MRHARFLALSARFMANTTRHAAGPHIRRQPRTGFVATVQAWMPHKHDRWRLRVQIRRGWDLRLLTVLRS